MSESSFDEMGFLSDEIQGVISKIRAHHKFWFERISFVNKVCQKFQYDLEVNKENQQEKVMALLFARTLSNFQAAVILAERGMEPQSMAAARNALESLFWLKACSLDKEYIKKYLNRHALEWEKILKRRLKKYGQDISLQKQLDEVSISIKENGRERITAKGVAEKAGMLDWYESTYFYMSGATHSSAKDVEIHHLVGTEGTAFEMKNEPSGKYLALIFKTLLDIMLNTLPVMEGIFKARVDFSIEEFRSVIDKQYLAENPTT